MLMDLGLASACCLRFLLWISIISVTGGNLNLEKLFNIEAPSLPPPNKTCTTCTKQDIKDIEMVRQHRKSLRLQNIKVDILYKLGLNKKPDVPSASRGSGGESRIIQRALLKLRMSKEPRERRGSTTTEHENEISEIVSLSEEAPGLDESEALKFTLNSKPRENKIEVLRASLWVLMRYRKYHSITSKKKSNLAPPKIVKLRVHRVNSKTASSKVIATSVLKVRHTSWKQLLLPTSLIKSTMNSTQNKLIFKVTCDGCSREGPELILLHKRRRRRGTRTLKKRRRRLHKRRPFIIIETKMVEEPHTLFRVRRSSRHRGCRVRRRYITFRQMDWDDWIISPRGFNATWCSGRCRPSGGSKKCLPNRRSDLQLTYYDGKQIVNGTLSNWSIESCSCKPPSS